MGGGGLLCRHGRIDDAQESIPVPHRFRLAASASCDDLAGALFRGGFLDSIESEHRHGSETGDMGCGLVPALYPGRGHSSGGTYFADSCHIRMLTTEAVLHALKIRRPFRSESIQVRRNSFELENVLEGLTFADHSGLTPMNQDFLREAAGVVIAGHG